MISGPLMTPKTAPNLIHQGKLAEVLRAYGPRTLGGIQSSSFKATGAAWRRSASTQARYHRTPPIRVVGLNLMTANGHLAVCGLANR